jgi:hypothetical protein
MNKVSAYASSLRLCILIGILIAGFIVSTVLGSVVAYICLVWFTGCIVILILNFGRHDVHITHDQIILTAMRGKKEFQLSDLVIRKVSVRNGPEFIFETNKGVFRISYTRDNYSELLRVLEYLKYPRLNKFKESVTGYIISPR